LFCVAFLLCVFWIPVQSATSHKDNTVTGDPRQALGTLLMIIRSGFRSGVDELCHADDAPSRAALKSLESLAAAVGDLHTASRSKFGDEDAVDLPWNLPESVRGSSWECAGDGRAVLLSAGVEDAPMVVVDGYWRLDLTESVAQGRFTPAMRNFLSTAAGMIEQTARDVADGKITTAESASRVLRQGQSRLAASFRIRRVAF
jgi:hypothetical protein